MPISNRVAARVATFKGQKSGVSLESTTIEDGSSIVNMVLKEGQMERINGGTIYAEILGAESGGITSLARFKNLTIAQRNLSIAVENAEASATFTTLTSALGSNAGLKYSSWRDREFMVNGVDCKFLLNRAEGSLDSVYDFGDISVDPPHYPNYTVDGSNLGIDFDPYPDGSTVPLIITTSTGGGPAINNGLYAYYISFFDAETNSESPVTRALIIDDGLTDIFETAFDGRIPVANGSPFKTLFQYASLAAYLTKHKQFYPRITHFRIYRGSSGATLSAFKAVPFVNASSTQNGADIISISAFIADGVDFIDNTVTASLPLTSPPENNYVLPTTSRMKRTWKNLTVAGYVTEAFDETVNKGFYQAKFFRDQLFGVGAKCGGFNYLGRTADAADRALYRFSDILFGSEVYQPDYFPYIWEVGRGDGQNTVGLGVLGDTALLVFKNKSTYYLTGSSPDNFTLRIMDTQKGCINAGTIQETPNGVICLDRAGFVLFNKIGQGEKISKDIQDIIDDIQTQYADTFYSWYDPEQRRYYCSLVVGGGATTPNFTVCLDLDSGGWTTIQGTEGLSRVMDTDSNGASVDVMGSATSGRLTSFADPTQVLFNDQVIESSWTSGSVSFGDDQHKKKVQWLYIRALSKETWTVDIEIIPDYDESRKFVIEDWNVLASQSEWYSSDLATDGSLIWDEGTWASSGLVRTISKIPIKSLGYSFQIRIINKETNPERYGFILQSVSIEGVRMGR